VPRLAALAFSALLCAACNSDAPRPAQGSASTAATSADANAPECKALRSLHATINKTSGDFGRKNKQEGGGQAALWRGFADLAKQDAAAPAVATSPLGKRYEERLRDIRRRSVEPFLAAATAEESGDPAAKAEAERVLTAVGDEWRKLGADLANGCAPF
jgi:hypothetical protein